MKQHQVVMSAGLMLAALLAGQAQAAPSVATGVALGVATRGSVNASPALDAPRASPICLWQVPSKVQYVNLYALQQLVVRPGYQSVWETALVFNRNEDVQVAIPRGEQVNVHIVQIEKRLAACRGGE